MPQVYIFVSQKSDSLRRRLRRMMEAVRTLERAGCRITKHPLTASCYRIEYERSKAQRRKASELTVEQRQVLRMSPMDMELSVKAYNKLKDSKIKSVRQLVAYTQMQLARRGFARRSLVEIAAWLEDRHLHFGMKLDPNRS